MISKGYGSSNRAVFGSHKFYTPQESQQERYSIDKEYIRCQSQMLVRQNKISRYCDVVFNYRVRFDPHSLSPYVCQIRSKQSASVSDIFRGDIVIL